jgi:hypothetical protein
MAMLNANHQEIVAMIRAGQEETVSISAGQEEIVAAVSAQDHLEEPCNEIQGSRWELTTQLAEDKSLSRA